VGASTADAQVLRIEAPGARVTVIPEARRDILVQVRPGPEAKAVKVSRTPKGVTVVAGSGAPWLDRVPFLPTARCRPPGRHAPAIVVRTPRLVQIESSGGVLGRVQPSGGLKLTTHGCGDWTAERLDGKLMATINGPAKLTVLGGITPDASILIKGAGQATHRGTIGNLRGHVLGSGKIRTGVVQGVAESKGDVTWTRPKGKRYCTIC
jgi:hypothetical protein